MENPELGKLMRMAVVEITRTGDGDLLEFAVTVREGGSETSHRVGLTRDLHRRLTADEHTPEALLHAALRFLLDREPKESILGRFDVAVIARYFPEFERELQRYLASD